MLIRTKNQALLLSALFAIMQGLPPLAAVAQAPADPAAGGSGPIDIQAHEQEFTGDHVIAKGNVKVLYKDTTILAPLATLYRDLASGQPQKAIFTGHPRLVQGANKIDADQLIFEMTTSKIYADGHAHSEVVNNDPVAEPINDKKKGPAGANGGMTAGATPSAGMVSNGKGGFEWPTQEGDRKKAMAAKKDAAKQDKQDMAGEDASSTTDSNGEVADSAAPNNNSSRGPLAMGASGGAGSTTTAAKGGGGLGGGMGDQAPTKIITDSDRQEYDRDSGRFEAFGNVRVIAGDIHVTADHLKLAYGIDHRPEAAIFNGHVNAIQDKNNTASDFMTYFLNTKRLQASGHVRSKVIQDKSGDVKPVPKKQEEGVIKPISNAVQPSTNSKTKSAGPVISLGGMSSGGTKAPIIIVSDSQDYNKETGRLDAIGNARIFFEDTIGIGPKVILMKNADGQAEKIIFVGRSQVTQKGKRWIGDRVTILVADRRVLAEGNTKAVILQKKDGGPTQPPLQDNMMLAQPKPQVMAGATPASANNGSKIETSTESQLAGSNSKLSATKVDRPE
jgi:lipopolysaccharide export system protein LptA